MDLLDFEEVTVLQTVDDDRNGILRQAQCLAQRCLGNEDIAAVKFPAQVQIDLQFAVAAAARLVKLGDIGLDVVIGQGHIACNRRIESVGMVCIGNAQLADAFGDIDHAAALQLLHGGTQRTDRDIQYLCQLFQRRLIAGMLQHLDGKIKADGLSRQLIKGLEELMGNKDLLLAQLDQTAEINGTIDLRQRSIILQTAEIIETAEIALELLLVIGGIAGLFGQIDRI